MNNILIYIKKFLPVIILLIISVVGYFIFVKPAFNQTNEKFNNIANIHLSGISQLRGSDPSLSDKVDSLMTSFDKTFVKSPLFEQDTKNSILVKYNLDLESNKPILSFELVPSIYTCFFVLKIKENNNYNVSYINDTEKKENSINRNCLKKISEIKYYIP